MLRRFLSQALALSWLSLWLSVPGSPCANKKPVKMEKLWNGNQRHTGTVTHTRSKVRHVLEVDA